MKQALPYPPRGVHSPWRKTVTGHMTSIRCDQCTVPVMKQREWWNTAARPVQGPGAGLLEEVPTHMPGLRQVAGHPRASFAQAPGYTLTALSDLGCYPHPHKQCICKLSLGLGLQTIHSFIHSTNIYCGTSLAVQWLRLCASNAGGMGSIPSQGTKIPHAAQQKKKKKHKFFIEPLLWA